MRENLRNARLSKGWNKKETAAIAGVTGTYYGMVESGRYKGSVETWVRLSEAFAQPITHLIEIAEGSCCTPKQLKELRESRGLTQKQLAEALNIPESSYCILEKGKTRGTIERWKQISEFFGTPVTYASNKNYGRVTTGETDNKQPKTKKKRTAK